MTYLINLFPDNTANTYNDFQWAMKEFGETVQISQFCWMLSTTSAPEIVLSRITDHIDCNDRIFISSVQEWWQHNFPETLLERLEK